MNQQGHYLHQLFAASVAEHQLGTAIIYRDTSITYAELDIRSTQLANKIIVNYPDDPFIGISTTRGISTIIAVLAILKSGKAYIPLDKDYPEQRLTQIITDSRLTCCIAIDNERSFFNQLAIAVLSPDAEEESHQLAASNQFGNAYVLYTSGSTGAPKGVLMGHGALVNLLQWQSQHSTAGKESVTLQFSPLTFDVSFQEIFATLTTGGTLALIDDDTRLNSVDLLTFIDDYRVNRIFLPFVALQLLADTAYHHRIYPQSLREIITAGEQLKITAQLVKFFSALPSATLYNQYGPTECHVVSALELTGSPQDWPELPSIGTPIDQVYFVILDDALQPVQPGTIGELYIGGACLAEGYLHQEVLTAEKFINWEHQGNADRIYKTGDLVCELPDGNFEFLGRKDHQVKVRGYRIELGEIEVQLNRLPQIQDAVVQAFGQDTSEKKLVAFLIPASKDRGLEEIKQQLKAQMPAYMMPSAFIWVDAFPKTASGKVDRKALTLPILKRPDGNVPYKNPSSPLEKQLAALWAELLYLDRVGIHDNFFDLGGNSLLAQKTVNQLQHDSGHKLPITKLYQHPTIAAIAAYFEDKDGTAQSVKRKSRTVRQNKITPIAVVGMEAVLPGAANIEEFLQLLRAGGEGITFFKPDELDPQVTDALKKDPDYVAARGVVNDIELFDCAFFGISPTTAEVMDPQQRVFLELSYNLLEKTGNLSAKKEQDIGVFAGCGTNHYFLNNVLSHPDKIDLLGKLPVSYVNEKDYISSRTAYHLDLKGPAVSVLSACSTSALAVAQAVESLQYGHCELAIAGGASIHVPTKSGHIYQEGAMFSKDGHCRPFDADATGTVFSDGAGAILLKPLDNALADGDTIYAVIKGIGINNDGNRKSSFTAPSSEGQRAAIEMAIANANLKPAAISYVETHGTATPIGDPIEIEGLSLAFGETPEKQHCAIGSVKSNIGHLTHAAGIAGIIKTCLSLYHKQLFPTLHYRRPNPAINFTDSPFYVNTTLRDWEQEQRIAGVSSFGVGGTNLHLILGEAPATPANTASEQPVEFRRTEQLICWSAKSEASIQRYADLLTSFLREQPGIELADIAYTLLKTRQDYNYRAVLTAASVDALLEKLTHPSLLQEASKKLEQYLDAVVFMFPGQGAQFVHMGWELYREEPHFKAAIDRCIGLLDPTFGKELYAVIYPEAADEEAAEKLKNTYFTQPAIFIVSYALAQTWTAWGLRPQAYIGHSIGEFLAAHLAGVFSLEDALKLVTARAAMIQKLPAGSMLSVRMSESELRTILPKELSIAAANAPMLTVVSGEKNAVTAFSALLTEQGTANRLLHTSHAFHSSMMLPAVAAFEKIVSEVALHVPKTPIVSTVTGEWLTDEEATSAHYWSNHMVATVKFAAAVDFAHQQLNPLFLEVGPGNVGCTLVQQQLKASPAIPSLPMPMASGKQTTIHQAAGKLWQLGISLDWSAYFNRTDRSFLVQLPTYAYNKKRYWLTPAVRDHQAMSTAPAANPQHNETQSVIMRKEIIIQEIRTLLEGASGIEMGQAGNQDSFFELGFDSLLLTQIASNLKSKFNVPITFRQLNEDLYSLDTLAQYLDEQLPAEAYRQETATAPVSLPATAYESSHTLAAAPAFRTDATIAPPPNGSNIALNLVAQQLNLLAQQIQLMQGQQAVPVIASASASPATGTTAVASPPAVNGNATSDLTADEVAAFKKPFGATAKIDKHVTELSEKQLQFLQDFVSRYNEKTKASKDYCQQHRSYMADPRIVSGFKPYTKEMIYSLVVNRSDGSSLWDIDGNQYVDALNGFGSNFLGYQAPVLKEALLSQIEKGYEIGPQHELAGEVCNLICSFTGFDRAGLCNTGSEAVLGAIRIARTVTGKKLIVAFNGSYHGINDEVLVRGTKKLKSFPAAAGIMPEAVHNILVLDYGTDEALSIIRERAADIAAVLVEPVQSRRPEFQPIDFLKKLRQLTNDNGLLLIFDEVITGFRMHPGGAQALFGVKADLATYGKVIGGGLSIGAIAGKSTYMDALDGGFWQYGDASVPEVGVTYFAGTFVRHPLALATAWATLNYLKTQGPALQESLNAKTQHMVETMNTYCIQLGIPVYIAQFGSLWKIKFKEEYPYYELIFAWMRFKGVHIWDGFPCFLTTSHSDNDIAFILRVFRESLEELVAAGFIPVTGNVQHNELTLPFSNPPVLGAKLGKDSLGNPAWFVEDSANPGNYLMVNSKEADS
ncbi:polyketide synthase [Parapedobacter lycopersici]|uniref:polyketide synthase n=1 Tax=Parapedobacter lycopersici TaxID=1864939 RepID=UPI00214D8F82|nr:polyketide synthase [Parapedobacter lycopersici]